MDLQEAWKKLDREKLSKPVNGPIEIHKASKHPVQKLIRSFRITLSFVIVFEVAFIYLLITSPQLVVKFFMALMVITYIFFFVLNYSALRRIERHFILDSNFKDSLTLIYDSTKTSLTFQRRASLVIYPFACTAGYLWGLSIDKDVVDIMQKGIPIIALVISIVILTPASYYLALCMEKVSYGKYLAQLETLILELNQVE
jgi:hypothetical protein